MSTPYAANRYEITRPNWHDLLAIGDLGLYNKKTNLPPLTGRYLKFFIPTSPEPRRAEILYAEIKSAVSAQLARSIMNRRIFAVDYVREGKSFHVEVGKPEADSGDMVFAILQVNDGFVVCTTLQGVFEGIPIFLRYESVHIVEDFES